jgi:hypothetical protein
MGGAMKRYTVVLLIVALAGAGSLEAATKKKSRSSKKKTTSTAPAQRDDWPSLARAVSPLIESYAVVGPASMRVQLNADIWNSLSRDQQQQIADVLASKQAVQSMRKTLHLYVYETEVGSIGPSWSGDWRFRRE